jgi:histidinol phosphatase-like PHP family hydrolase
MEISRRVFWPGQLDFCAPFYRQCKEAGLKFTIGSDAHRLDDVGNILVLQPLIDTLGLAETDFWSPRNGAR